VIAALKEGAADAEKADTEDERASERREPI
jgi:hypothetical protein